MPPASPLAGTANVPPVPPDVPVVSFVIPVKDDAVRLARCLKSIRESDCPDGAVEIIVVDNGSSDGSDAVAAEAGARVMSLPRLRVAALRNAGALAARGDILAFVDADHEIVAGWIEQALEALATPGVVAVGAPYHPPADATWVQRMYDAFRDHSPGRRPVEWLASGNLAVRHDVFTRVGGFDTSLETCEDVDLCQRLRMAGHEILSDAGLRSVHHGDPRTLRALFSQELWHGRDNLRASLRGPVTSHGLPSIVLPAIVLDLIVVAVGAEVLARRPLITALALAALAGLAAIRARRMLSHLGRAGVVDVARALVVAAVYDFARALAPLLNAEYHHVGRPRRGEA
jgi:GT2 family glycosyltransferase